MLPGAPKPTMPGEGVRARPEPGTMGRVNDSSRRALIVPPELDGERLDRALVVLLEDRSRSSLKTLIDAGGVVVAHEVCRSPSRSVAPGEVIEIDFALTERRGAVPPGTGFRVLYDDGWVAAIDKPVRMTAHPSSMSSGPNVAERAVAVWGEDLPRHQGEDRPGIVHRLDRDTTGVMLLALGDEAFHSLRAQFKTRVVKKQYRALVYGDPRFDADLIEKRLARDPRDGRRVRVVEEGGREAQTRYEVLERFGDFADVHVFPTTGRTHQIRVHMMSVGHPIVGDGIYRSRRWHRGLHPDAMPDVRRQLLHAWRIEFDHPRTGDRTGFEAPLHADHREVLNWLRRRQS